MEINWSEIQLQIKYGRVLKKLQWNYFRGWLETDGLLILERRSEFTDLYGGRAHDVIELSQISEEESASFKEMLAAKVKPSRLATVRRKKTK